MSLSIRCLVPPRSPLWELSVRLSSRPNSVPESRESGVDLTCTTYLLIYLRARHANIQSLNLYWSSVRQLYQCFDANVRASDSGVFDHEMPGGQYTNLMFQSQQLGLTGQWKEVVKSYIDANQLVSEVRQAVKV